MLPSLGRQLLLGIISAPGQRVAVAAAFVHAFVPYLSHFVRDFPIGSSIHHEDEGTYITWLVFERVGRWLGHGILGYVVVVVV